MNRNAWERATSNAIWVTKKLINKVLRACVCPNHTTVYHMVHRTPIIINLPLPGGSPYAAGWVAALLPTSHSRLSKACHKSTMLCEEQILGLRPLLNRFILFVGAWLCMYSISVTCSFEQSQRHVRAAPPLLKKLAQLQSRGQAPRFWFRGDLSWERMGNHFLELEPWWWWEMGFSDERFQPSLGP